MLDNSWTNYSMKHAAEKIFQLRRYFLSLIVVDGVFLCYDIMLLFALL